MKKVISSVLVLVSALLFAGFAAAATMSYHDVNTTSYWVATDSSTPAYWVQLGFPDAATGTYTGGAFEYDNYLGSVQSLVLTLTGKDDNSSSPVDIYVSFSPTHSTYSLIGSYNVGEYQNFTLAADIKNNQLLYNGSFVSALSNINLNSFVGSDFVWVGYGCHFTQLSTSVDVSVNSSAVPEPCSSILVGFGLIGLEGLRRKFRPTV